MNRRAARGVNRRVARGVNRRVARGLNRRVARGLNRRAARGLNRRAARVGIGAGVVALVAGAVAVTVALKPGDGRPSGSSTPTTIEPAQIGVNPFRTGHTLVIPHGGGDGLFPENTLLAYTRTMAMGADVVDVDLRLTADDTLIAFHDATLDRITGTSGNVREMTFAQLRDLDAGYTFHPSGHPAEHPFRGTGVTIPTLESLLRQFPTALLSLDLKDESMSMVEPLCTLLTAYHRLDDVFVGSNSDDLILQFRKDCPSVRTSATMVDVYASRDARASNDAAWVPAVTVDQPPFRSNGRQLVDEASLAWAHAHDVAILPWVVNDEADMRYLIGLGIDGIYTSYPDRLLRVLGRCTAEC